VSDSPFFTTFGMTNNQLNSREIIWFIGNCLSLAVQPERKAEIKQMLESGSVDWQQLVYHASNQLVLPALFLNLQRNDLLDSIPEDLALYLEDITKQNRIRNQAILNQIKGINHLLTPAGINPVYLKGTAHLLCGLYQDIAERMLSDVDFILNEKEATQAWDLLIENGYKKHNELSVTGFGLHRHLIELVKDNEVASVEIHTRLFDDKQHRNLNFSHLETEIQKLPDPEAFIPSVKQQILHNILNVQSNDKASKEPKVLLRNSYDLLLLSQKEEPLKVIKKSGIDFDFMNNYLALSADLLGYPPTLTFGKTIAAENYIEQVHWIWEHPAESERKGKRNFIRFRLYRYVSQFLLLFIDARVRKRIFKSLGNKDYRKAHWAMYKRWFS